MGEGKPMDTPVTVWWGWCPEALLSYDVTGGGASMVLPVKSSGGVETESP